MRNPAQGGASASLVSDTEASTPKAADTQLHAVDLFADWYSDVERPLRIRIYQARDRMLARVNRSKHERARTIYWIGAQMAADWAFWRAGAEELNDVLAALTRIIMVADTIERLESPDA